MNNLIDTARRLPVGERVATVSVSPVTLSVPERGLPLELRVTAPAAGRDLPVVLLSHGGGPSLYLSSKDGYAPLAGFYAEHGFAVIQPTHLSSRAAGLPADAPGGPLFWRSRVADMSAILDRLDEIGAAAPAIAGRLDPDRVAAVGHSLGGQTVGMLLGARVTDPGDGSAADVDLREPRVKAGVLLAAPGNGGADLAPGVAERYPGLDPDFSHLTTPTLVVAGDADASTHLTVRGPDWHVDPFRHAPGGEALLTLFGAGHGLGGIAGFDAKETDDEDPDRLATVQRMTWAYLRSALFAGDPAWAEACRALREHGAALGRVELA